MIKQLHNPVLRLKIATQSVQNYPKSIGNGCCHFGNKSLAELHNYASRLSEYPLPFTFTSVKIINYSSSSLLSVLKSDFQNFHSNTTKISHDFLPIWLSITLERCLRTPNLYNLAHVLLSGLATDSIINSKGFLPQWCFHWKQK